jgi:NDP-sugar pyrophosphorylase family protein
MGDRVRDVYGDAYKHLHLLYSHEDEPLDTGGALRLALPYLKSDPVLVLNGDSYVHVDLNSYVDWFFQRDRRASLLLTTVSNTGRYGTVKVGQDENIVAFEEKGLANGIGWISAGVYLLRKSVLRLIPTGKAFSLEWELFPSLVGKGFFGYQCKGNFMDIGTPESYSAAEKFFKYIKL